MRRIPEASLAVVGQYFEVRKVELDFRVFVVFYGHGVDPRTWRTGPQPVFHLGRQHFRAPRFADHRVARRVLRPPETAQLLSSSCSSLAESNSYYMTRDLVAKACKPDDTIGIVFDQILKIYNLASLLLGYR